MDDKDQDDRPPLTFGMVDGYYTNGGPFKSRQHIVNHVDMLLGLTGTESGSTRDNRYMGVVIPGREHPIGLAALADLEPERLRRCRAWSLRQSIFAERWEQIIPSVGDSTIPPAPLSRRDAAEIFGYCIDEWVGDRDIDAFVAETAFVVILGGWPSLTVDRVVIRRRPDSA